MMKFLDIEYKFDVCNRFHRFAFIIPFLVTLFDVAFARSMTIARKCVPLKYANNVNVNVKTGSFKKP